MTEVLKAWQATDNCWGYSTVVFAETRGKAKALAAKTDCCEGIPFTQIRIYRVPELDNEYRGHWEMDWCDDEDRLALVKKCGWYCIDAEDLDDCSDCVAKEYCPYWEDEK